MYRSSIIILLLVASLLSACQSEFTPKPKGYPRMDFPAKVYQRFDTDYPYAFDYPSYAKVVPYQGNMSGDYWMNIEYPSQRATLHISYFQVHNNLDKHLEESRTLTYKHTVRADAIEEHPVVLPDSKVFGLVYDIKGNAASTLQFYVTDSTKHFLRGALYFNVSPNSDSLAPVNEFIGKDVEKLISSLRWK